MRVIYIAGTSHSGSTLLSLMLNANSEIMSVGEIQNLNRQLKSNRVKVTPVVLAARLLFGNVIFGAPSMTTCAGNQVSRYSIWTCWTIQTPKIAVVTIKFCLRLLQAYPARISSSILQSIHGEWPISCVFEI